MNRDFEYTDMLNKKLLNFYGEWSAGNQLDALRYYLKPTVKILKQWTTGSYQGECYALLKFRKKLILWRDSYGSCSGCDALEGEDGYSYIKGTLTEGNCKTFSNEREMEHWLLTTKDYLWDELKSVYGNPDEVD